MNGTHDHFGKSRSASASAMVAALGMPLERRWADGVCGPRYRKVSAITFVSFGFNLFVFNRKGELTTLIALLLFVALYGAS